MPRMYYERVLQNKTATDEVLINGVLHTGDLGKFDKDGNLYITGRKKIFSSLKTARKFILPSGRRNFKSLEYRRYRARAKNGAVTLFVGDKDGNIDKDDVKTK